MEKAEGRKVLRRLQAITNFKGDEQAQDVIDELRRVLPELPTREKPGPEPDEEPERKSERGRDRQEKGGRNRSEG